MQSKFFIYIPSESSCWALNNSHMEPNFTSRVMKHNESFLFCKEIILPYSEYSDDFVEIKTFGYYKVLNKSTYYDINGWSGKVYFPKKYLKPDFSPTCARCNLVCWQTCHIKPIIIGRVPWMC